ncbi:hypothetical protein GCM10023189_23110 [Nibrella saemangeumensis]|uniref:Protein kinase domain-containing protein n=1 Tax=Nibrella saemangeumensis TaxID=1084526 RepID=A0ABP8MWF6_9BACT
MAKVFTITEGLENMGALRTGGQGSVYKGRRIGEIITAVKLLPTPIHTESADDKNFRDFQNEVDKLKKVNEQPNPNVVKILNSGLTESGSFPFIEMEFIEGPDLEELLKPPHEPVFSIREVMKVADQLGNALAHCHKVGVRHGDIKSNNVKFNIHTGNYVLLDFGLAIMSDEQRRTSLRHAGAIEFMAPEQNEGQMLFQTDVYSFGVVLYEILAGRVPFPLTDKGETARNNVMVAHMETPVPDVLAQRRQNLPASWTEDRKTRQMQVPEWLLTVISKCLEKRPENRYQNGMELHEAIVSGSTLAVRRNEAGAASATVLQTENERLQSQVLQFKESVAFQDREIATLREAIVRKDAELNGLRNGTAAYAPVADEDASVIRIPKAAFFAALVILIGLGAFAGYQLFASKPTKGTRSALSSGNTTSTTDTPDLTASDYTVENESAQNAGNQAGQTDDEATDTQTNTPATPPAQTNSTPEQTAEASDEESDDDSGGKLYTVQSDYAHFHTQPDESARQENIHINKWNNARLKPLDERRGFIYVVYTNEQGQVTRGWLNKKDLKRIDE